MRILRNLVYPKFRVWKRARKLTVQYDGNTFQVISDRRVKMAPPPSDPIADYQNQIGMWYSILGPGGRVLYRRVIPTSLFHGIEVFTNSPTEQLFRVDALRPVTLVLVFPDLAEALQLEVFRSRQSPEGRPQAASSLLKLSLTEAKRGRR